MSAKKKILVLCASDWDRENLSPARHPEYEFSYSGGELIENPTILDGLRFDITAHMRNTADHFRGHGLDGVIGTGDYPACMLAAGVAERLGLRTPQLRDVVLLSHKYYSREIQKRCAPEATPQFAAIDPFRLDASALSYPVFVKPVKGTMSIRAQLVRDPAELRRALQFSLRDRVEKYLMLRPFQHLLAAHSDGRVSATSFIAEAPLRGVQVTVDGFVQNRRATAMGVVDSVMYPGTISFERFEYPSRLPAEVIARMEAIAVKVIEGSGLDHTCFNIEMFYDASEDRISIIEINPRMSYQFGDLYERVDGTNTYEIQLALATGAEPRWKKGAGADRAAASFVMRRFADGIATRLPSAAELARIGDEAPGTRVHVLAQLRRALSAQPQDIGSYRYCIVNMGAANAEALHAAYKKVRDKLAFEFR